MSDFVQLQKVNELYEIQLDNEKKNKIKYNKNVSILCSN